MRVRRVRLETKREVRAPEILECARRQLERWRRYSYLPNAARCLPPSCATPLSMILDALWLVRYRFFRIRDVVIVFIHSLLHLTRLTWVFRHMQHLPSSHDRYDCLLLSAFDTSLFSGFIAMILLFRCAHWVWYRAAVCTYWACMHV